MLELLARSGLSEQELRTTGFARLWQRARLRAWRDVQEARGDDVRTALATFVQATMRGWKGSFEEWLVQLGIKDDRPTEAEKDQVLQKIMWLLPPNDPDRVVMEAAGLRASAPAGAPSRRDQEWAPVEGERVTNPGFEPPTPGGRVPLVPEGAGGRPAPSARPTGRSRPGSAPRGAAG